MQYPSMFPRFLRAKIIIYHQTRIHLYGISVGKKNKKGIMKKYGGQSCFHFPVSQYTSEGPKLPHILYVCLCVCLY